MAHTINGLILIFCDIDNHKYHFRVVISATIVSEMKEFVCTSQRKSDDYGESFIGLRICMVHLRPTSYSNRIRSSTTFSIQVKKSSVNERPLWTLQSQVEHMEE